MTSDPYNANFDYKDYSLEKLQEWVHSAMNSDASPHEIYSAIREAVREDYYYHKDCISRASGLLELLSGHRPVADKESFEAALAEREYYEGVKDDGMRPWGHSDLEYQIANQKDEKFDYTATGEKFPIVCDKDDSSPECKEAWNDFWEENYYPEEYKKNKVKRWVLPVNVDGLTGDCFVNFPDDLLEAANLKEGDEVEWVDQGDGSCLIKKVTQPLGMDEC
jgi:hypothetical protein